MEENLISALIQGGSPSLTMLVLFALWYRIDRKSTQNVNFDLNDDRTRNWEDHSSIKAQVNVLETKTAVIETKLDNQQDAINETKTDVKEILSILRRGDK